MITVKEDGKEPITFPHVSLEMNGLNLFLCTFDLGGEFCHIFHDTPPDEDYHHVHAYLNQLAGVIANINFWTLTR